MDLRHLDLVQWQDLLDEYKRVNPLASNGTSPLAMRCENSQLTTGWRCGGFTLNGHAYTSFCPRSVHGPCAMLAVRDDLLRWVSKKLKPTRSKAASPAQLYLF